MKKRYRFILDMDSDKELMRFLDSISQPVRGKLIRDALIQMLKQWQGSIHQDESVLRRERPLPAENKQGKAIDYKNVFD